MKSFNLSAWSLAHKNLVYFFIFLLALAGMLSYARLGRMEDPDYTIRQMVVSTTWDGATAKQVEAQITDPLEKKLQDLEGLDHLESYSLPGQSVITVELKDTTKKDEIAGKWADARNLVQEEAANLPQGAGTPVVNDHFDSVYGMLYALTADDGYSYREMKDQAESIRQDILALPQTKQVELLGTQTECIYVDADRNKMSKLGLSLDEVESFLQAENTVADSGLSSTKTDNMFLRVKDEFHSPEDLASLPLTKNGRILRLADFSQVKKDYLESGSPKFFYQGKPAIGIAVSMTAGENIIDFGKALQEVIASDQAKLPAGMEIYQTVNQAKAVDTSIDAFVRSLVEALLIIFAVSLFSLGRKAGIVVVLCIPFVLAITFSIMYLLKIDLHSVSLGALIIGLGLLVDDAMIVVEMILVKLEEGAPKREAVTHAFAVTARPMLTGTLITCAGFIPVAFATGSSSEFCVSLFYVITIALLSSWIVAGAVTPLLSYHFIDAAAVSKKAKRFSALKTRFYAWYQRVLQGAIRARKKVLAGTLVLFLLSCGGFFCLHQEFFPASTRPELIVRLELPADASYKKTEASAQKLAKLLQAEEDVKTFSYTTGMGLPRYVLTFNPAQDKPNLAEFLVTTKDLAGRQRLREKLPQLAADNLPEARLHTQVIVTGTSSEYPVMMRVQGPSLDKVHEIANQVEKVMRQNPDTQNVCQTSGEKIPSLHFNVDPLRARQLGVTAGSLAQDAQRNMTGKIVTTFQDGDDSLPVLLRLQDANSDPLAAVGQFPVSLASGISVPLEQVAAIQMKPEEGLLFRYNRQNAIQVCAEVRGDKSGDDVAAAVYQSLASLQQQLPPGYQIKADGTLSTNDSDTDAFLAPVPIMVLIILVLLMFQLQNATKTLITLLTAPLGLIGVVAGLLLTGRPFGFVVMVGMLALSGIIIRNSVILIDQIEKHRANGESVASAVVSASVSRLRPIMLTAMAAVLAMIPLSHNALWGPMAVAMGAGLLVATVLTLIILPVMYAAVYLPTKTDRK